MQVFISYRHVEPDATLARSLADALEQIGFSVFIDTNIPLGGQWGNVIDESLDKADCLVALVSAASAASAMVAAEIEQAHRLNVERGRPIVIPIRLGDAFHLKYPLSAHLSRFQQFTWRGPQDTGTLVTRLREALTAPPRPSRVAAQRMALIDRVRGDWIKGVLEKSLHHAAQLELSLAIDQTTVARGLDVVLQLPSEAPQIVDPGTPLLRVFDDQRGQLLILGAPGSGKTTLLLELARDLLDRAQHDDEQPIPVILNLSSWAVDRHPLDEWMISELNLRSDAPKKLAREWVTNEQILPLLDGLDEVALEHREACVSAINAYRRDHGWVSIVVCSRKAEYETLFAKLVLPAAIIVQPLQRSQVELYLETGGEALAPVRAALRADARLWELLDTPLMLSVVSLAYVSGPDPAETPTPA